MEPQNQVAETNHSCEVGELFGALSKAQGKITSALKDKKNSFFKCSYADLSSIWDACRGPLSENGLAVIQTVEGTKEAMFLITWLGHSSGQWMKSVLPLILVKMDPQGIGSAITYAKRYSLSAMVGVVADEDDDGEKAMGRNGNGKEDYTAFDNFVKTYPVGDRDAMIAFLVQTKTMNRMDVATTLIKAQQNPEGFKQAFEAFKNTSKG